MFFEYVVAVVVIFYVRRFAQTTKNQPELDKLLKSAMVATIVLLCIGVVHEKSDHITAWVTYGILAAIAYFVYTKPELAPAKPVIFAALPYIAVAFISEITVLVFPTFYYDRKDYFDDGKSFAVLWMLAMVFIYNRQKKALEKERKKTQEAEKEIKITEQMKAVLEVQVAERTAQLTQQKEELQKTISELQATQQQLIQAEKMASLGQLTAGIAHEIQNPLNFVNNFSEVSNELIEELQGEMQKVDNERDETLEHELLNDIKQNLDKIQHHGKRADAIVKGMLQHSRASSGQKEPVNINALADEYLKLSYHGLRAKDKSFNATMVTRYDETLPLVNVIPQDIGRVFLNLINNAFYAVCEKQKREGGGYKPEVSVSTLFEKGNAVIKVKDNGSGIPDSIKDKIMQPFFTTKPTGEGTGLGLSLSYDIIVKGHGGSINMASKEGEGTEFVVNLPTT